MFKRLGQRSEKKEQKTKQLEEREINISPMFKWLTKRSDKKVWKARLLWGREFNIVEKGLDEEQVVGFVNDLMAQYSASLAPLLKTAVTDAEQMAASIKLKAQTEAEAETATIIDQAKQEAEEIKRRAEIATQKEAEDILSAANRTAELQEEVTGEVIEQPVQLQEEPPKEEIEEPPQLQEEARVSEPVEVITEEHLPEERPGRGGTESALLKQGSQTLYAGEVELAIGVPVVLVAVSKLYNHLQTIPEIRILRTTGSWDRGTTITVVLDKPIPLISIISKIPGVEVTPELPQEDSLAEATSTSPLAAGKRGVKRIKLTLKEAPPPVGK